MRIERDKDQDMLKLEKAFFANLQRDNCEYGAIGVDCKRPFGNSDVEGDILELIGDNPQGEDGDSECWASWQRDYAASLYNGLIAWLQAKYAGTKEPGRVVVDDWLRQLVLLVGVCVQQQQDGYDVLASAAWDDVLTHWNVRNKPAS